MDFEKWHLFNVKRIFTFFCFLLLFQQFFTPNDVFFSRHIVSFKYLPIFRRFGTYWSSHNRTLVQYYKTTGSKQQNSINKFHLNCLHERPNMKQKSLFIVSGSENCLCNIFRFTSLNSSFNLFMTKRKTVVLFVEGIDQKQTGENVWRRYYANLLVESIKCKKKWMQFLCNFSRRKKLKSIYLVLKE